MNASRQAEEMATEEGMRSRMDTVRRSGEVGGMLLLERRGVSPPHTHRLLRLVRGERAQQGRSLVEKGVKNGR